jgi:hypothetical protein
MLLAAQCCSMMMAINETYQQAAPWPWWCWIKQSTRANKNNWLRHLTEQASIVAGQAK